MVLKDVWQELVALGEPPVVLNELLNASLGLVLDTNSNSWSGPVK